MYLKYKLYDNSDNNTSNVIKEVLKNRGIEDYNKYLNLDDSVVIPYDKLDNINSAVELFNKHFQCKNKIGIIPDPDVDGQCSASEVYSYIKRMDGEYPITILYHQNTKAHGLDDITVPDDIKLLIVPDAGTNDYIQCRELKERGIDVLILDHHEQEDENSYALIVNNQCSHHYKNKQLCGGGIVYKWMKALDDFYWNDFADDYLDLVAFSNISDVMDLREFETRYLVNCGLLNINNKFLQALIKAQDYSMNGKINIHNVQWYLTPVVNAMLRIGSNDEKELLFRAFIEQDEYFEYKKRATKDKPAETIRESIYDRAARLCKNAKSRQDKMKEKGVKAISEVVDNLPIDDKVIMVDVSDLLDSGLTGVVAIKIAEQYNKPCILLKKHFDKKTKTTVFGGSARNIDNSPIDSFKDIVNSTGFVNGKGHANAFGIVDLPVDDKEKAINMMNSILRNIEYDSTYRVDFILDINHVTIPLIIKLSQFEDIICQGIDEPMLAIENISLTRDCFEVFGKNEDTISFMVNDIKYIQFKCKEGNQLYDFLQNAWDDNDSITFNIVGKPSINEYNGIRTPQIIIEDVAVISINSNDEDDDW
nr:MAG TPA: single-stranded-DNA-specific exonuclease RecJ [Bacteriophage sp.]